MNNNVDRLAIVLEGVVKIVDKLVDKVAVHEKRIAKLEEKGK